MLNKVALITGAAMGYKSAGPSIGGAIAMRLAKDGYKVVVVDRLKRGKDTVNNIKKAGGEAVFLQGDVTKYAQKFIAQSAKKYKGLNCLVNCVARYSQGMAQNCVNTSKEEWDKTLAVNLGGYFLMCKHAIPLMQKSGGGSIINISSNASFNSLPNFCVYSAAKAAINGLTRSLAVDFAPLIRSNAICPGFVRIENSQGSRTVNELKEWYGRIAQGYPMKRVCEVDEIAGVVSFLASDDASYINGQCITVDGGRLIADQHEF